MEKENIINYIIQGLKNGDEEYQIERYLKIKDVNSSEFETLFETAKNKILEERLETYPKKNKQSFIIWTILTVALFVIFFFILPKQNISHNLLLSIIGAISLSFSAFHSLMYYKSWEEDFIKKVRKPKKDLNLFFAISAIPIVILYFIISWCLKNGADNILKNTQEDAIATIIDGSSVEGRRLNFADITVQFETKDGKEIIAVEDVSTYEFKQFYKGQKLNIIYSKDNPQNIDLLIDDENIRQLKDSQEREIVPTDLINLLSKDKEHVTSELNKINFGWAYNSDKSMWINEKRQNMILINDNQITFIAGTKDYNYTFPKKLLNMGFKKTNKKDPADIFETGEKTFENENYKVSIKSISDSSSTNSIIIINKK